MISIFPVFTLRGDKFSPKIAERRTGVVFAKKNEPGEIGSSGRYRGKPIPYGSAELKPSDDPMRPPTVLAEDWGVDIMAKHIEAFRKCGATDVELYFSVEYRDQCNLEFSSEFLEKLAKLNISFTLSCYEGETSVPKKKSRTS